jgi:hypothetical protein
MDMMELEEFSVPIPTCFFSTEHGTPFTSCTMCSTLLISNDINYFVEKYYRNHNIVFEYAICEQCKNSMSDGISNESMFNMSKYFMENVDILKRIHLLETFDNSIVPWMNNCIFTDRQRSNCSEYQLAAQCCGDQLIVSFLPFMVSMQATEEIQTLISKATKENFDKFREKLNPPVNINDLVIV